MNSIKIGTLVIASMFTLNSFAQNERIERVEKAETKHVERADREEMTPEQQATQQTERIAKKLNLTEEQRASIFNINVKVNMKNKAVLDNKAHTKEYKKDALQGNNESRMYLIHETLTTEQQKVWNKMMEEKAAKQLERKESHEGHDHDGHSHH